MNTTAYLLAATAEIWKAYYRHPFVLGIQNGTLDKERFRFYLIQDDLYLEEYAKTFALGAAKAESLSSALLFSDYLAAINRERAVHGGYPIPLTCSVSATRAARPKFWPRFYPARTAMS